ncbi:MAG: thiamine pyrophosphate-dependent enzyme [Fusobacteria bacterium]|nr:thiamine pyrophosphate-dependent enzyme [Fusobacteriota bacterium]
MIDSLSCHRNPLKTTILEVIANEKSVIEILSKYVEVDRTFVERWRKFEQIQKERFSRVETLREYEGWFVREILRSSAEAIFVSSSMSVRYLDYFYSEPFNKMVFCNRGVNGIDGTFSTALGVSTRKKGNTILITGDLAFIHDMNGMVLAKTHELPLVVVLFNNDGGGIFNYLPQSGTETFNYLFTTSHGLEFESIIRGYGHHYKALSQGENFLEVLNIALERKSVTVIEIKTDREKSVETTKKLIRGEM